ncbi:hypothetical protein TNCV_1484761 [Trichonephila clavipes]|nr:hypothetical protein TNCV_1484761 [Trichonephila clavipes]
MNVYMIAVIVAVALNRRLISGVWTVNSPQSHIVRVYDAGHGKSGVFHSAEWHDGDWSSDGIREATATAGSDVVQSGRPIFDDFFQYLWPYIGNNTANVVFQMVKRLWLIRIDQ